MMFDYSLPIVNQCQGACSQTHDTHNKSALNSVIREVEYTSWWLSSYDFTAVPAERIKSRLEDLALPIALMDLYKSNSLWGDTIIHRTGSTALMS